MFLRNTSSHPTPEVRALVQFATSDIDMRRVCVNVKGSRHAYRGRAYPYVPNISNAPRSSRYLFVVAIGTADKYPAGVFYWSKAGATRTQFPRSELRDWREGLVYVAAHEAKHIEQFREHLRHSELACEHFAVHMLKRYRSERPITEPLAQAI